MNTHAKTTEETIARNNLEELFSHHGTERGLELILDVLLQQWGYAYQFDMESPCGVYEATMGRFREAFAEVQGMNKVLERLLDQSFD